VSDSTPALRAVEWAARSAYGRLVATLAARTRDVAEAEDALSDAFAAAPQQWPTAGVPDHPDAWLLAVARRRLADAARHAAVVNTAAPALEYAATLLRPDATAERPALPDQRAMLLFACAHPAIDQAVHAPLMLQVVLGLDADRIAAAFLVKPSAMAQRWCGPNRSCVMPAFALRDRRPLNSPRACPPCSTPSTPPSGRRGMP
jgi:RNA polymerase sigma-70 factor (ECF subfamily)